MIRTYSELIKLPTFEQRFDYLNLHGKVGESTFGFDRYLNQKFYKSSIWKQIRRDVIVRDNGCDLGIKDYEILGKVIIHHMNPVTIDQLSSNDLSSILNPDYLICTSLDTHNAIHYGDKTLLTQCVKNIERSPFDTCPWKH